MLNKILRTLALTVITLGLIACGSSTRLIESWHNEAYTGGPKLETVLVLGVFQDDTQRRAFEARFVESVNAGGKKAIAGYTLMPEESDYNDKEDIVAAVQKVNADSVLITSFKGETEQQRYVPPRVDYVPSMSYGGYYGSYYGSAYGRVYQPGYTVVDSVVSLETRVYAVNPENLVWAGNTKSVNSASPEVITGELVKIVIDDMRKSGLIE
jgi:hypothetical protein